MILDENHVLAADTAGTRNTAPSPQPNVESVKQQQHHFSFLSWASFLRSIPGMGFSGSQISQLATAGKG